MIELFLLIEITIAIIHYGFLLSFRRTETNTMIEEDVVAVAASVREYKL